MLEVVNKARGSDLMLLETAWYWYFVYNLRLGPPNEHILCCTCAAVGNSRHLLNVSHSC